MDLPQLSVSLNVQIDRTACLHTLNTYLNTLLRSCTVVPSPYQLFNAKKGWRKWLVCVLRWFLGRMIPLRQAIRFHINLWQECRRPNTCRPAADEALLTQEKISGTQGNRNDTYVVKFSPCPPPPPKKKKDHQVPCSRQREEGDQYWGSPGILERKTGRKGYFNIIGVHFKENASQAKLLKALLIHLFTMRYFLESFIAYSTKTFSQLFS